MTSGFLTFPLVRVSLLVFEFLTEDLVEREEREDEVSEEDGRGLNWGLLSAATLSNSLSSLAIDSSLLLTAGK